jgi:hypothetical protein
VTSINNVVIGRIHLEHKGAYSVRCLGAGGLTAAMRLHATTMLTPQARKHEARACLGNLPGYGRAGVFLCALL